MTLLNSSPRPFPNMNIVEAAVAPLDVVGTIEFTTGSGAGFLVWNDGKPASTKSVHVAIPLRWLEGPEGTEELTKTVQHFVAGVLSASSK